MFDTIRKYASLYLLYLVLLRFFICTGKNVFNPWSLALIYGQMTNHLLEYHILVISLVFKLLINICEENPIQIYELCLD